jgi:predicted amidohydrolase YtcJ
VKANLTMRKHEVDLVLYGGKIYPDPFVKQPMESLLISEGKVVYLGESKGALRLVNTKTEKINLEGKTVIPAFTDCHLHFLSWALSLKRVNLDGISDFKEVLGKIKEAGEKLSPGEWLLGRGWNKNLWRDIDLPNKAHLDTILPENPILLHSKDGHTIWANSRALKLAKIDRNTPDPEGGLIARDPKGEPTGILHENACLLLDPHVNKPTRNVLRKALLEAIKHAHRQGVVGIHDCEEDEEALSLWQELLSEGKLDLRVYKMIPQEHLESASSLGLSTGYGDEFLRIGPVKIYADGALGSQTALMFEAYQGRRDNFGVEVTSKEGLQSSVDRALKANLSVAVHAIGDKANYNVISVFDKYKGEFARRKLRPRIEHAQLLRRQDIPRFAKSNIIASVQPSHLLADRDTAERYWGSRCKTIYPFKSLLKSGTLLCFGSDAPIERLNPLEGIYAAVNRKEPGDGRGSWYPQEKLKVSEAIAGFTTWAAQATGEDDIKGSLAVGRFADMVVLSEDIFRIAPEEIHKIKVLATFLAGRMVYRGKSW